MPLLSRNVTRCRSSSNGPWTVSRRLRWRAVTMSISPAMVNRPGARSTTVTGPSSGSIASLRWLGVAAFGDGRAATRGAPAPNVGGTRAPVSRTVTGTRRTPTLTGLRRPVHPGRSPVRMARSSRTDPTRATGGGTATPTASGANADPLEDHSPQGVRSVAARGDPARRFEQRRARVARLEDDLAGQPALIDVTADRLEVSERTVCLWAPTARIVGQCRAGLPGRRGYRYVGRRRRLVGRGVLLAVSSVWFWSL